MKPTEKFRFVLFWTVDFLKGNPIGKHYNEIRYFYKQAGSYEFSEYRKKNLKAILQHAGLNCSFYKNYNKSLKLSDFPLVNKSIIKDSEEDFLASNYKQKKLYKSTTSGSTGTPFSVYHNLDKRNRNYADTIFFAQQAGYKIGAPLIYLKIWVPENMKSKKYYQMQNMIPVDVIRLNDTQIQQLFDQLQKKSTNYSILAYSSALELICKYLSTIDLNSLNIKFKSAISMSETMNEYTKKSFLDFFGIPVLSRYSNLENGIIAQQILTDPDRYLINTSSYHVEVLKFNSDLPVDDGEPGRIIVTDYFNYSMPLIRYDTGDVGTMESDKENPSIKYFTVIEGRKLDLLYDTKGELVSSYLVYKNMWQYAEIDQYQLIQEDKKKYLFKINAKNGFDKEQKLIKEFKQYLGKDADFRIEYVAEIPLLSSGKRKKIVNKYINQD